MIERKNQIIPCSKKYISIHSMSPKIVLITGAAGFIGINLALRLLTTDPHTQIYAIDNELTSTNPCNKIPLLCDSPRYHYFCCDIVTEIDRMREWLPSAIDEIYHLASIASPPKYKKYPIETLDVNVIGTRNMLDIAVDYGAHKFLLTSTSEVYGDPAIHPQPESYYGNVNCVGERSCYDESKRCAETYVYEYRRKYNADLKICRIFNTYGPYMDFDDGRVITNMVRQFCRGERVTIYGQGTQTRSFCFISDLLDGLVGMMASSEAGPMNLGNPFTECNMVELAQKVMGVMQDMTGNGIIANNNMSSLDLVFQPLTENDPLIRRPDISLAQEKIGFHPRVGLLEGLKHMVEFYRDTHM